MSGLMVLALRAISVMRCTARPGATSNQRQVSRGWGEIPWTRSLHRRPVGIAGNPGTRRCATVHGAVMAVAGELPDQPSWALALWNGLLLLALDGWDDNSIPLAWRSWR